MSPNLSEQDLDRRVPIPAVSIEAPGDTHGFWSRVRRWFRAACLAHGLSQSPALWMDEQQQQDHPGRGPDARMVHPRFGLLVGQRACPACETTFLPNRSLCSACGGQMRVVAVTYRPGTSLWPVMRWLSWTAANQDANVLHQHNRHKQIATSPATGDTLRPSPKTRESTPRIPAGAHAISDPAPS